MSLSKSVCAPLEKHRFTLIAADSLGAAVTGCARFPCILEFMETTPSKPRSLRIAQCLFGLNAIIWLIFGLIWIVRLVTGDQTPTFTLWVVVILIFGNMGAMLLAGWRLGKTSRWPFFFAVAVLSGNLLLTFTDQVGFFDFITAFLDLLLLGILLYTRRKFF